MKRSHREHRRQPWYCEFSQPAWEEAEGDTPALAICRAALKAVAEVR